MACWRQGPKGRGSWVVTPVTDRGDMRGNLPLHPLHALHRVFELWSLWRVFFYVFLVCAIQSIQDTTNFPNVHVHLPEIRRKAGLVGHTGHHYTTSTPHLAGQLRVGEAAQDRGPRRCLSHPWSMSITYHRTYHFNGSSMFKHVQTEWWQVMMPTCQRPALSLEQSGVECMAQTDQRDCQVSHMPCKCVACSCMKKDEVSKLCHYFCKVGGLGYFVWKLPASLVSWCFKMFHVRAVS